MSRVSVIIPTYNRAGCVAEAIDSVLSQTVGDVEVIVVDDGSTDRTPDILHSYRSRVIVHRQENAGVSAARNKGIELATGHWIAFLDSDDRWMPEKLERQLAFLEMHPELIAHVVNVKYSNLPHERACNAFANCGFVPDRDEGVIEKPFKCVSIAMVQSVLCQRQAVDRAGLFDRELSLGEDYDFLFRLALQGPWGYHRDPLVEVIRRQGDVSYLSKDRVCNPIRSYEAFKYIYHKYLDGMALSDEQADEVRALLAKSLYVLAVELLTEGRNRQAYDELQEGAALCPGCKKTKIAMLIARLPAACTRRLMRMWRAVKHARRKALT